MRRIDLRALLILAVAAGTACVPALREPPTLDVLAARSVDGGAQRLEEAGRLWEQRTLESVTRAAELYQASVNDEDVQLDALLGAARTHLWIADHHEGARARLAAAVEAINFAQWCARVAPDEPECDYRLALGIGLQVKERRTTAADGLPRIVELLKASIERDPRIDHAGPHRVLALVYLRAPGWPGGPGDVDLGLEQAEAAVRLAPDYPPNRMALAEAWRELDEIESSREEYREAVRLAEQQSAAGVPDAEEWLADARSELGRLEQR